MRGREGGVTAGALGTIPMAMDTEAATPWPWLRVDEATRVPALLQRMTGVGWEAPHPYRWSQGVGKAFGAYVVFARVED